MASAPLYEAATNVLRQVYALYDTFVVVVEDTTHPLHNGVVDATMDAMAVDAMAVDAMAVDTVHHGQDLPAAPSQPDRDFSSIDRDDLRDPVVQPTLDAIERLKHVASGSAPTAENAHCVWAVWAATYSLYYNSKLMYDDIRISDITHTHLYYMATEVEETMDPTECFGVDVERLMFDFQEWVWDEGEDYLTELLQETVGEDRSLVRWMEQLRTETEMAQW